MSIVNTLALESNSQIKINFDGGDLSSDAGLNNTQLKNLLYGRAIPLVRSYDISYPLKDTASYACMT